MLVDNDTIHEAIHDIWSMQVAVDGEPKLSFEGKTPRSLSEVLIGTRNYMEGEKQKWISQNAKA